MWLLALGLLCPPASAQDAELIGLPIAGVSLVAGDGSLPDKNLQPLLRAKQGEAYTPLITKQDIATLFRVGEFSAVQADAMPWPMVNEDGEPELAVMLTYEVYVAPRVASRKAFGARRIRIQGNDEVPTRVLRLATGLAEGALFYPEHDAERVQERVLDHLVGAGFPDAVVEVDAVELEPFAYEIWVRVSEGTSESLSALSIDGLPPGVDERLVKRWLRKAGVQTGEPLDLSAVDRGRFAIQQALAKVPVKPKREGKAPEPGGWVEASVRPTLMPLDDGTLALSYLIDPGPQLVLSAHGVSPSATRKALGIDERLRLTRGFEEQAPDRLVRYLQRKGFRDASATVRVLDVGTHRELEVHAERGRRVRMSRIHFSGNSAAGASSLRTVMKRAVPTTVGRGRVVDDDLDIATDAVRRAMVALGYESAKVSWSRADIRGLLGKRVRVDVAIEEGPVSTLTALLISGSGIGDPRGYSEGKKAVEGKPLSPHAVRLLSQSVVKEHRQAGFLDATARAVYSSDGEGGVQALIEVDTGHQVLLRSFSTRGNRRVSSTLMRRVSRLRIGAPITSKTLDNVRFRLYELGMFTSVVLEVIGDGPSRDLVAIVRERARNTIETAVGISTDQGLRTQALWTHRNLFASADQFTVSGLVGIGFNSHGPVTWLPGLNFPEYSIGTNYRVPIGITEFGVEGLIREELQERNWRLIRSGGALRLVLRPTRRDRITLRMGVEARRLRDADPGAVLPNEVWAQPDMQRPAGAALSTDFRPVDIFSGLYVRDQTDNPLNPTKGLLFSVLGEMSPGIPLNSTAAAHRVPYVRGDMSLQAWTPLGPLRLRVRLEGGHAQVIPLGALPSYTVTETDGTKVAYGPAVPVETRYRVGGTGSMRGFRRDAVGPQANVRRLSLDWPGGIDPSVDYAMQEEDTRWVPTGGDTFARATLELLIPFPAFGLVNWQGWAFDFFADVGNAWLLTRGPEVSSQSDAVRAIFNPIVRYGVGAGLRVQTPVGPLQLDLGVNPEAAFARTGTPKWLLLREQWREPPIRVHLTLGTLF